MGQEHIFFCIFLKFKVLQGNMLIIHKMKEKCYFLYLIFSFILHSSILHFCERNVSKSPVFI